jgi:dTDP-4-dehydrorhamnose reductase
MKILVIGAEGQVGTFIRREWSPRHEVLGTSLRGVAGLPALDIGQAADVRHCLEACRPEHVVLSAAFTHVDRCEELPALAETINTRGAEHVARACRAVGAGMTFFSTDYIFDGVDGPYDETAKPNPLSVYGLTKLKGEEAVASTLDDYLIVRTMVVYSYLPDSVNLFMQVASRLSKGEPLSGPSDQMIHPTQAVNLAQALGELVEQRQRGIYNLAGTTWLGRDEFIRRIVARMGGNPAQVRSLLTADFQQPAKRPLKSGLVTGKAQAVLRQHQLWDLDTALDYTLRQMPVTHA